MRQTTDARAGEYLQATIGTAYKVHPNCGSTDQRAESWDYDYPEPIRVRFAICREHRQIEQPQTVAPFVRRALRAELPGKVLA